MKSFFNQKTLLLFIAGVFLSASIVYTNCGNHTSEISDTPEKTSLTGALEQSPSSDASCSSKLQKQVQEYEVEEIAVIQTKRGSLLAPLSDKVQMDMSEKNFITTSVSGQRAKWHCNGVCQGNCVAPGCLTQGTMCGCGWGNDGGGSCGAECAWLNVEPVEPASGDDSFKTSEIDPKNLPGVFKTRDKSGRVSIESKSSRFLLTSDEKNNKIIITDPAIPSFRQSYECGGTCTGAACSSTKCELQGKSCGCHLNLDATSGGCAADCDMNYKDESSEVTD